MSLGDRVSALLLVICTTLVLALPGLAAGADTALAPAGVYVHTDIEKLAGLRADHQSKPPKQGTVQADVTKLLNNPAIVGITVGEHWNTIEPKAPPASDKPGQCSNCDWSYLDDVFAAASAMPGKTVQLIITPGFDTPQWLKDKLKPCDDLFTAASESSPAGDTGAKNATSASGRKGARTNQRTTARTTTAQPGRSKPPGDTPKPANGQNGAPGPDCGLVKFVDFPEQDHGDPDPHGNYTLPLPWNEEYQKAWYGFLEALNQHFKKQSRWVAIAVAGPIAGSDEFILPTTDNGLDPSKGQMSKSAVGGLPADQAWSLLIGNYDKGSQATKYPTDSDQIFIDAWDTAIDKYEKIFSGLTLFIGPDSGKDFPTFGKTTVTPHQDDAALYAVDCGAEPPGTKISCEAKTEIIAHFIAADGPNGKATQVGGMTAASATQPGTIGVAGSKLLTAAYPNLWTKPQAIAGAEFDHAVSNPSDQVGCPTKKGSCTLTPEQAAANVLKVFFSGTPAGEQFGDKASDNLRQTLNYLDVPYQDVEYFQAHACTAPAGQTSLQLQIAEANYQLLLMSGDKPTPVTVCRPPIKPVPPIEKQ